MKTLITALVAYASLTSAAQPSAAKPIAAPLRKLPWAQLNFLHTTDTHGWHAGHLQEAQYGADWGDYISFAQHLRQRADEDGSDLLLIRKLPALSRIAVSQTTKVFLLEAANEKADRSGPISKVSVIPLSIVTVLTTTF